ncbi:MAG: hypothetical protein ACK56I_22275, partial [bacterium]
VEGRFGNVLRLFEAVAVNTRKWQVWEVVAASGKERAAGDDAVRTTYASWRMRDLLTYFQKNPEVGSKMKSLWATRLASRLGSKTSQTRTSSSTPYPTSGPNSASAQGSFEPNES